MSPDSFLTRLRALDDDKREAALESLYRSRLEGLRAAARPEIVPLSPAQQRLWYLAQAGEHDASYNIPGFFRLRGRVEPEALHAALREVAARHEILRTRVVGTPPRLEVSEAGDPDVEFVDASSAPLPFAEVEARAAAFLRRTFDIEQLPLWRALVLRQGPGESFLVLSFHHIVFDGWSLKVFMRELLALLAGQRLEPLAWQYPDYAVWERNRAALRRTIDALRSDSGEPAGDERFWQDYLEDMPGPTELALDGGSDAPAGQGKLVVEGLPGDVWQPLVALAREQNATPFAAALAVLDVLLYRRSGKDDLIVGTPVSGRGEAATQELVGTFVNTIPLRTKLTPGMTARELFRVVADSSVRAFAHEGVPFDRIVELTNPVRSADVHPIFQLLFTFQPAVAPEAVGGVQADYLDLDFGTAKFDLSLDVVEDNAGVRLLFEYSTGRFSSAVVESLAQSYRTLVEDMAARPDTPIEDLQLVSEVEQRTTLARSRGPAIEPKYPSVLHAFREFAARSPGAAGVTAGGREVSYRELDESSDAVGMKVLAALPDAPVVAVLLPRSAELFSAVLGVWKAGKACLTVDPELPTDRIAALVADAGAAVVTERAHLDEHPRLCAGTAPLLVLSEQPCDQQAQLLPGAGEVAYLVYTSGSTGRPKGVRVSHAAYASMLASWVDAFALDEPRCLQIAASSFDVFYGDLARGLGAGGHLVVVEPEVAADPERFAALVRPRSFDFAEFVPSVFRRLAHRLQARGERLDIRHLVVASEAWAAGEAREWSATVLADRTRLYNTYGVAEATVDSSLFCIPADGPRGAKVPIGRPLPGADIFVVDARGRLVPRGVAGHLRIGGRGLSDGYVGAGAAENVRFSTDGVAGLDELTYDTGDIGYWDGDGQLVLVGRSDDQVKLRGVRIELGEVEQTVRGLDGVADVAAAVVGEAGRERLVAWTVAGADDIDVTRWRKQLAQRLPTSMLPEIVLADALPYLASGKIDRVRLGQLEAPRRQGGHVPPRTPQELEMHRLFCQVLDRGEVSVDDSFFALGGHSLTALELISRIHTSFGVKPRVSELFDHPTVEGMTLRVADLSGEVADDPVEQVVSDLEHRYDPFPLTDVQQAYWLGRDSAFEFSGVSTHSYDELHGKGLDVERFTWALNEVIRRHEMMRAVILDYGAQQILAEVPAYRPVVHDLSGATQAEIDETLARVRAELSHQQLDMTRWPNFDIRVTVLPGEEIILHFSTDALLLDAWSFVLVVRELGMINDGVELPELEFSFRDYVLTEQRCARSGSYARSKAYWDERIPTLPAAPDLPLVVRPDDLDDPRFTRLHARLPREQWATLKRRAADRNLTPTGVCLAAYTEILAQRVREPRFSVNLTFLQRKLFHPQVNEVAGEFTSTTLLEVDRTDHPTFVDGAFKIQRDLWEVLEQNEMSGVQVLREYARHHDAPTAAHFPVVFTSALGIPMPDDDLPVRHRPEHGITQTSQVWLDAGIWEDAGELCCNWDIVLELYPPGFVESMFEDWTALLSRLAEDPAAWDRHPELHGPEPLATGDVPGGTLLDGFLARLSEAPEATAVISPRRTLTYRELADRAGCVADALHAQGVSAGEPVAVVMDVGWEQVAAVLGTTAVAAYLPLNADTPDERLLTITELAGVRCILTQPHLRERLERVFGGTVLCVEDVPSPAGGRGALALVDHGASPDDLAYVIFTSGSTGVPKGVMIDHRGAVNTIVDVNERFAVGPSDRVLALSALSFDLSVYDVFGMLAAGGAIVMPDPALRLDPLHQVDLVAAHGVSVWNTVPALFGLFVGALDGPCPSLRLVMLSGDWIPLNLPAAAQQACPNASLHSLGGATEASIWSITYPIAGIDPAWTSVPYGKGMKNQDLVVLDTRLQPCHEWVTGDLYIRGVGLALGYWGDRLRTDEAFFRHPVTGERLYRTGDLGRLLPDGNIEFLGRSDFQLKIGGYRVEAGEVERAVLRHPDVGEAAVLALGERLADKRLACAWVRSERSTGGAVDLAAFLSSSLPPYMVPLVIGEVDALPLSSNGKVDRKALAGALGSDVTPDAPYVAPTNAVERRMVAAWEGVLDRGRVGMHDDFFQIGGDSIAAIELVTAVRRLSSAELRLGDLYTSRTPAGLLRTMSEVAA